MQECNFTETTKDTIKKIEYIVNDLKSQLKDIENLMKETTNKTLKDDINKIDISFKDVSVQVKKLNDLSKIIENVYSDIIKYQSYLKEIKESNDEILFNNEQFQNNLDFEDNKKKLNEIYNKICPKKEDITKFKIIIDFVGKHFSGLVLLFVFLCLALLSSCGKFDMDNFIKNKINSAIQKKIISLK